MLQFKDYANPIGEVRTISSVEGMVAELMAQWNAQLYRKEFLSGRSNISKVTNFLLYALDGLMKEVNEALIPGPDKKATVLDAIDRLYEYTIREAMPFWMRPLASPLKSYIVHILISNSIDWIVLKYKDGSWKREKHDEIQEAKKTAMRRQRRRG